MSKTKKSKKRKKKSRAKKIFLSIILLIIVVLVLGVFYLNTIIKMAIEKYGSEATRTVVKLKSVLLSFKAGAASISGLTIANPKGFETVHAFSLDKIGARIDIKSITGEVKIIDEIIIHAPKVYAEINKHNAINLNELKKNLVSSSPSSSSSKTESKTSKPIKLIIRHFRFSDGDILMKAVPLNKEYKLKLPAIELKNLGGKTGATPAQITIQVLTELTNRALTVVRKKGLTQGCQELKNRVKPLFENEKQKARNKLDGFLKK